MKNTVIATSDSMTATRMAVIGALIDFVKANQIRRVLCPIPFRKSGGYVLFPYD